MMTRHSINVRIFKIGPRAFEFIHYKQKLKKISLDVISLDNTKNNLNLFFILIVAVWEM